ncbi:putative transposase, partial [Escherichia coli EC1864]
RMVLESQGEYDSQWAAICSLPQRLACTPETLRVWVRQHERDTGVVMVDSPPLNVSV